MGQSDDKVTVENVNHPEYSGKVNRAKYENMKTAMLKVLPSSAPGHKVKDVIEALKPYLSQELFPEGQTAGWWQKTVQLDLEAKGLVVRADIKPLHIYKN